MSVVGVLMIGVGALLCWEAWESHKNGTPPTPIQHLSSVLTGTKVASSSSGPAGGNPAAGTPAVTYG